MTTLNSFILSGSFALFAEPESLRCSRSCRNQQNDDICVNRFMTRAERIQNRDGYSMDYARCVILLAA